MAKKTPSRSTAETPEEEKTDDEVMEIIECGLVMPISEIDGCPESHWDEVKQIFIESVESDFWHHSLSNNSEPLHK